MRFIHYWCVKHNKQYDAAASVDEEISSWEVAYTVSDDLSISYGSETIDTEGSAVDEEAEGINVSYTTGGVTISATSYEFSGKNNTITESASGGDVEKMRYLYVCILI